MRPARPRRYFLREQYKREREIYWDLIRYLRAPRDQNQNAEPVCKFSAAGGRHQVAFDPRIRASAAFSHNGYEIETTRIVSIHAQTIFVTEE